MEKSLAERKSLERKSEREKERGAAGANWEGGAERWDGGRFLPARSEILGVFFCVLLNLLSNKCRTNSFLHASCASYIAKAIA